MTAPCSNLLMLLTPSGAGAIGLIRVVGPSAVQLLDRCLRLRGTKTFQETASARLRYGELVDGDDTIDDVVVCVAAEESNKAIVDITLHGGVRVLERALELFESKGARLDVQSNRTSPWWPASSLIEAEACAELQRARTERAVAFIARQRSVLPSFLEAMIETESTSLDSWRDTLAALVDSARTGILLAEGASIAIVGPPNSGKSTLFNHLVGRPAAVVSPIAGTTRDWISQDVDFDGVPITLIDTAGRHETTDALENLAIRQGTDMVAGCELQLVVLDSTCPSANVSFRRAKENPAQLFVFNKIDQNTDSKGEGSNEEERPRDAVSISAASGVGVDELVATVLRRLGFVRGQPSQPCLFTQRQAAVCTDILSDSDLSVSDIRRLIVERLLCARSIQSDRGA